MSTIGSQASLVTPEWWEEPDMRDALSTRDISSVYRLLRKQGISQRQIAASTGQSQSEVSEILKGRQVMAYDVLARIADGLSIPRGYVGLAYDEGTEVRGTATADDPGSEEDEQAKRRRFLAHAAAVTAGAAAMDNDDSGPKPQPEPSRTPLRLLGRAACLLPAVHQARYREEWAAELDELARTAARWHQFVYSVRLLFHAIEQRRALIRTPPDPTYEVEAW